MALYNNGYPVGYQPYYQQYQQPQQGNSGIIWVSGEAGAKAYLVAPNSTVQLWDSERQTIYLKSADASGMPSIKVLDYTIRNVPNSPSSPGLTNLSAYATKDEFEALRGKYEALRAEIDEMISKKGKKGLTADE